MENPMFDEGGWCDRWSPTFLSILRIMTALLFLSHGTSKILGIPLSTASFPPPWTQFCAAGRRKSSGGVSCLRAIQLSPVWLHGYKAVSVRVGARV